MHPSSDHGHGGVATSSAKDWIMDSRISPGRAFGGLPVPDSIEVLNIQASVGTLTAMRTIVPQSAQKVSRDVALFIPGFTGSKEDFYTLFVHLAQFGWQVWAYSQRGQADSVAPEGLSNYTAEAGARDAIEVARIIAKETGQSRVNLVGHSYGGLIAQTAVVLADSESKRTGTSPQIFRSVALMCSGPHGWPERHADVIERLRKDPRDLWSSEHPTITEHQVADLTPDERFMRNRSVLTSRDELIGAALQLSSIHDASFELRDAHIPVLVFHGQNDFAWPQEWQRREAMIVGAQYSIIPGAGHLPNNENPAATADLFDRFWRGLDGA